jgi:hypothetical protein
MPSLAAQIALNQKPQRDRRIVADDTVGPETLFRNPINDRCP